jgi:hypothetical protein
MRVSGQDVSIAEQRVRVLCHEVVEAGFVVHLSSLR